MSQKYIEVLIPAVLDSGELLGLLEDEGVLGSWEEKGHLHLCWAEERWSAAAMNELTRALYALGADEAASAVVVQPLADQDWNSNWVASLTPIRVGRRLRVRQSWNPPDAAFDGIELVIDPKRAFGAGSHATTQLIIEWLEENVRLGGRVLDVGTGTGILSMAALRLGAASALGIDNDPVAIECAHENAAANWFGPELELRAASLDDLEQETFDLIVANLDRNTILRHIDGFRHHLVTGGRLCLSGLQIGDIPDVTAAVEAAGGAVASQLCRDEWVALDVRFGSAS